MNLMAQAAACFVPLAQLGVYQCHADPTWQKNVQSLSDFPPALWILRQTLDLHLQLRTRTFSNCFDVDTITEEWHPNDVPWKSSIIAGDSTRTHTEQFEGCLTISLMVMVPGGNDMSCTLIAVLRWKVLGQAKMSSWKIPMLQACRTNPIDIWM